MNKFKEMDAKSLVDVAFKQNYDFEYNEKESKTYKEEVMENLEHFVRALEIVPNVEYRKLANFINRHYIIDGHKYVIPFKVSKKHFNPDAINGTADNYLRDIDDQGNYIGGKDYVVAAKQIERATQKHKKKCQKNYRLLQSAGVINFITQNSDIIDAIQYKDYDEILSKFQELGLDKLIKAKEHTIKK